MLSIKINKLFQKYNWNQMYNVYHAAEILYTGNPRQIKTARILSGRSLSHRELVRIDNKLGVLLVFLLNAVNPKTLQKSRIYIVNSERYHIISFHYLRFTALEFLQLTTLTAS